jgi:hypothetical protein
MHKTKQNEIKKQRIVKIFFDVIEGVALFPRLTRFFLLSFFFFFEWPHENEAACAREASAAAKKGKARRLLFLPEGFSFSSPRCFRLCKPLPFFSCFYIFLPSGKKKHSSPTHQNITPPKGNLPASRYS